LRQLNEHSKHKIVVDDIRRREELKQEPSGDSANLRRPIATASSNWQLG